MKKKKKYLGIWILISLVGLGLDRMGFINILGKPSQKQEQTRQTFILEWNKLVGKKIEFTDNTMVVYVKKKSNPFAKSDDFAMEYHPKTVNGQSCSNLGIEFIQVRNIKSFDMLSGTRC